MTWVVLNSAGKISDTLELELSQLSFWSKPFSFLWRPWWKKQGAGKLQTHAGHGCDGGGRGSSKVTFVFFISFVHQATEVKAFFP